MENANSDRKKAIAALADARANGAADFLFLRGIVETAKLCGLNPEGEYLVHQLGYKFRVVDNGSIIRIKTPTPKHPGLGYDYGNATRSILDTY